MAPSKNQAATWYRKPQTRGTSSTQQKAAVKDEAKSQTKVDPDSAKATKPEVELPRDRSKVRFGLCLIRKNPQPHTVSSLERKRQRLVAEHFLNMLEVKKGRLKETDDDLAAAQSRRMQLEKEEQKLKTKLDDAQRNYDNHPLALDENQYKIDFLKSKKNDLLDEINPDYINMIFMAATKESTRPKRG